MSVAIIHWAYPPLPEDVIEFLLEEEPGYGADDLIRAYQRAFEFARKVPAGETVLVYDNTRVMKHMVKFIMEAFEDQGVPATQMVFLPARGGIWQEGGRNSPKRVRN